MYIASEIAAKLQNLDKLVMTFAAGQGKSIVIFVLMMILLKLDSETYKKFMVITTSNVLVEQLQELQEKHDIVLDITFCQDADFDLFEESPSFIVVDEADSFVSNTAVSFRKIDGDKHEMNGVTKLRGKFLLCSATFDTVETKIAQQILKVEDWKSYKSALEVARSLDFIKPEITTEVLLTSMLLSKFLLTKFKDNKKIPILVFMED